MSAFKDLPLQTARLSLRPLRAEDTAAIYAIYSDARVQRYSSHAPWTTMEQAQEFVTRELEVFGQASSLRLWLVRREDERLIGQCTLFSISAQNRRAEIGYSMAPDMWGQGYMDEALRALVDYGFNTLDLIRIEADIDPRNLASARSLDRLGFEYEGLMRNRWIVAGEISDTGFYGLLRERWRALNP